MKRSQSSLYREIENMTVWATHVVTRIPKGERALIHLGERLLDELIEAQSLCGMALREKQVAIRLEILAGMDIHLAMANTIVSLLVEWSSQQGQVVRIISKHQHAQYLTDIASIMRQLGAWCKKTSEVAESLK